MGEQRGTRRHKSVRKRVRVCKIYQTQTTEKETKKRAKLYKKKVKERAGGDEARKKGQPTPRREGTEGWEGK